MATLDFLRDVADGLGFRPDRVEEARQVVLRELAARVLPGDGGATATLRLAVAQAAVAPGDGLARRREELLERVGQEMLKSLPSSAAVVAFLVPECRTPGATADLQIATGLLENRMFAEIRQREGLSYSPMIWLRPVPGGDREWLVLQVPCAAGTEADVAGRMQGLVADLRERGWTEDETVRTIRPLGHGWRHALRDPMRCLEWLKRPTALPTAALGESSAHASGRRRSGSG